MTYTGSARAVDPVMFAESLADVPEIRVLVSGPGSSGLTWCAGAIN